MRYPKFIFIIAIAFLSGCAHYQTSNDSTDVILRPRTFKGPIQEIKMVAFDAAHKAFPDEKENITINTDNRITILRNWFWRGDTIINISIDQLQNNECTINAESKASHHRLNATLMYDAVRTELVHYLNELDSQYRIYLNNKANFSSSETNDLENKLIELKNAFEKNLITSAEYETKRTEIINKH